MAPQRNWLKLTSLKFISPVDLPAQETATAVLLKRGGGLGGTKTEAKVVKTNAKLGLVFCWAVTTKAAGQTYFDLHGDNVVEDDLIKVAADFMDGGGLTDEMHDRDPDGRVVFCMPMTAEVAKAFKVQTDTEGLMIGFKPSAEVFAKYESGEYTAVSIDGTGFRSAVAEKARASKSIATFDELRAAGTIKASLVTDEVDGHAHTVDICEDGSMYTSWATAAGADNGHSHSVVFGEGGSIEILADSGHSHVLAAGQPGVVFAPVDAIVIPIQASVKRTSPTTNAPAAHAQSEKSTRSIAARNVNTMKTDAEKIADLEKQLSELTKRASLIRNLGPTEHAVWKSLDGDESLTFLLASVSDRAPIVKRFDDSNAVVYKAADGTEYRMRDDQRMVALAKRADEETEKRLSVEMQKRADDMFGATKAADNAHVSLLRLVDTEKDGTKREAMEKLLKQLVVTSKLGKDAPGFGGGTGGGLDAAASATASEQLDKITADYQKANNVDRATARVEVCKTAEGRRLYAESIGRA